MDKTREDLLQMLIQQIMSIMRHVRHGIPLDQPALSPPQVHILFIISRRQEGISVKDLAERAGVTPGAITQFVDALVEKGLVMREGDPNDRRIVILKQTQFARDQFEKFRKAHLESFRRLFEVLSDDELKQLITLITRINTAPEAKEF
jgi:DNA-binding MarR family transcriptional regulator